MAYWNVRTIQTIGVQAPTSRELRKHNVDAACLSDVRIKDRDHSVIKVPGEDTWFHLYHSC